MLSEAPALHLYSYSAGTGSDHSRAGTSVLSNTGNTPYRSMLGSERNQRD